MPDSRQPSVDLRADIEPDVLPRQRRALERVAQRLDEQRPVPPSGYVAELGRRVREHADQSGGPPVFRWGVAATLWLGSGLALLALLAVLVASGVPGGR